MSKTYADIGEAIYDFMDDLDISSALPEPEGEDAPTPSWGTMLNRPPKADELNLYPAFAVTPARDGQEIGDTDTDFDAITYAVYIIFSNREGSTSEQQIRAVADIVRTAFRELRHDPTPLHGAAYNVSFTGEWGGTPEQGERWYRIDVTVMVHETLITEDP